LLKATVQKKKRQQLSLR